MPDRSLHSARPARTHSIRQWTGVCGDQRQRLARQSRRQTLYIEPGSPWENGYCESLNSKLRDELLNGEIFTTLREAQVLIEIGTSSERQATGAPMLHAARAAARRKSPKSEAYGRRWRDAYPRLRREPLPNL